MQQERAKRREREQVADDPARPVEQVERFGEEFQDTTHGALSKREPKIGFSPIPPIGRE